MLKAHVNQQLNWLNEITRTHYTRKHRHKTSLLWLCLLLTPTSSSLNVPGNAWRARGPRGRATGCYA